MSSLTPVPVPFPSHSAGANGPSCTGSFWCSRHPAWELCYMVLSLLRGLFPTMLPSVFWLNKNFPGRLSVAILFNETVPVQYYSQYLLSTILKIIHSCLSSLATNALYILWYNSYIIYWPLLPTNGLCSVWSKHCTVRLLIHPHSQRPHSIASTCSCCPLICNGLTYTGMASCKRKLSDFSWAAIYHAGSWDACRP